VEGSSGKARCYLRKHLTLKSGEPLYQVLEKDKNNKPTKVSVKRLMKNEPEIWVRVALVDGDCLMEAERL
jgi:hypothetical protein